MTVGQQKMAKQRAPDRHARVLLAGIQKDEGTQLSILNEDIIAV